MEGDIKYPIVFTSLGLLINYLIDRGETISKDDMYVHIENRTLWTLLEEKLDNGWIGSYNENQRNEFSDYFDSCANAIDSERKFGVVNNGYCLLIAYLFEAVQNGKETGWFSSLK
jgi:hypothetical protein